MNVRVQLQGFLPERSLEIMLVALKPILGTDLIKQAHPAQRAQDVNIKGGLHPDVVTPAMFFTGSVQDFAKAILAQSMLGFDIDDIEKYVPVPDQPVTKSGVTSMVGREEELLGKQGPQGNGIGPQLAGKPGHVQRTFPVPRQFRTQQQVMHDRQWREVAFVEYLVEIIEVLGRVKWPFDGICGPLHEIAFQGARCRQTDRPVLLDVIEGQAHRAKHRRMAHCGFWAGDRMEHDHLRLVDRFEADGNTGAADKAVFGTQLPLFRSRLSFPLIVCLCRNYPFRFHGYRGEHGSQWTNGKICRGSSLDWRDRRRWVDCWGKAVGS